ncbi:MAG: MotA/TolQ/ExbB proton channel family protein [Bacteroidales bacterium]|jgi:biopolymer transport protein ExbB|nr:MotA/TolQ/ExbB proton channel family protein [Bacteroidales bacterium]
MKNQVQKKAKKASLSAMWVILGCAIIAFCFFFLVCGNPALFDEKGHPIGGNLFGTLFMGGYVIPIVMTLLLTVVALSVERSIALGKAKGKGKLLLFVENVKSELEKGDTEKAQQLCKAQEGSVANVLTSALLRYEDVDKRDVSNDEKAALIAKEIEDATTLELPGMEKNLSIIATISTLGTLMGLFGTVLGMIKSFGAMGQEGAPDSTKLAVGISEALLNTAMGIGTGALAIIAYGYYSGKVQDITNFIDEVGFAIGQTFTKKKLGK